ncbi:hypothetical protein [Kitasatospora sp. NPDC056181]|uniref:hypothetical protein n=1 Tax=Kitasatospora sp. NPDC056181 TaxID=3345737 RepID=UPI0035DA5348
MGGTISFDHDGLDKFANTDLKNFLDEFEKSEAYKAVVQFSSQGGSGTGAAGTPYTKLLPGYQTFPSALSLQNGFTGLCTTLAADLDTLGKQVLAAQRELRRTIRLMDTAHEEAMTAAEMLEVLNTVISAGGNKPTGK